MYITETVNKNSNQPQVVSNPADDTLLWSKFREGCSASYALLYDRHAASLYQYGLTLTGCPEAVEDCIHDLFVELWERKTHLRAPASVIFYLLKALKHKVLQLHRKQATVKRLPAEPLHCPSPADLLIDNEQEQELRRTLTGAIERLSPRQQEVVFLLFYEGMTHAEIAQIMNISYQGVSNLVCRTMKTLRQQVAPSPPVSTSQIASLVLLLLACS